MSLSDVKTTHDVFFSYSSADRAVVQNVARRLREKGVNVWFDRDSLTPGTNWQDELAARLMDSRACAVFVGPNDIVGWERYEMLVALDRSAKDHDFRVFPVLLPGIGHFDASMLHPFLATRQWVDLRAGPESADAIQELLYAMRGVAPQVAVASDDGRECPYRGLVVFEEEHAPYFFGRTAQVQRLTETLRQGRFLAVIGQSGVGKSSLIRAGLLPRLRAESDWWHVLLLRPGVLPATTLTAKLVAMKPSVRPTVEQLGTDQRMLNEAAVVALGDQPAGTRLLVVVDQFEEVFTLCRNVAERNAFLQNLLYAATFPHGPVVVVVAMRADFYPRLVDFPAFAQLAQSHHVLVLPMRDEEMREVIIEPAYAVGLSIEQGLTETILADVVREPGTLPLLEHALLETWQHRSGNMLTLEGYRATGGVSQALGMRAEDVYAGLSDAARAEARYVFLRLIQPGEGTEDTRRRVAIEEITTSDEDAAAEVIREFVDARLLTTSAEEGTGERWVEISHEAVITGWAQCAKWVDEDRAGLIVHRRLTLAAQEWKRLGRSIDALYRGTPLAEALQWRARANGRLNWLEGDFLDAGRARERALRRSRRWRYATVLIALVAALVTIAVVAVVAVAQRNIATSRQLAAQANEALSVDPELSVILARRAMDSAMTTQADEALRQATAESRGRSMVVGTGGPIYAVRLLPDGRHVVTGSADGSVGLWDLRADTPQHLVAQHHDRVFVVRVTADGQTVASGSKDGTVRLTRLSTGQGRVVLTSPVGVSSIEFSHRGDLLAATLYDGTVHIIDVATGQEEAVLQVAERIAYNLSFSKDDALLAVANDDGTVQIWRLADRSRLRVLRGNAPFYGVEFSPSASQLATAGGDGKVRIWDVATGTVLQELQVSTAELYLVRYSPDGERLAAAGLGAGIYIWNRSGFALSTLRGHSGAVLDFDFGSAGDTLVSAGDDGTLRTWATPDDLHRRAPVTGATFDPDGTRIVAGGSDGRLRVWRRADLAPLLDVSDHLLPSHAVFAAGGALIASFADDGIVNIRDATNGRLVNSFRPDVGRIRTLGAAPDDLRLVIGGADGELAVVGERGERLETLSEVGSPIDTATFSPDGGLILAARADGSITLWRPDRVVVAIKSANQQAVYSAVFNADSSRIASADAAGSIDVWDLRGKRVAAMRGHQGPASAVRFRGTGELLVSAGADGTVRVWDPDTGGLLMTFDNSDGSASNLDVSPDGSTFLKTAEGQQALRLLTCEVCGSRDSVAQLARAREFRTLTPEEERRFSASD